MENALSKMHLATILNVPHLQKKNPQMYENMFVCRRPQEMPYNYKVKKYKSLFSTG